MKKESVEKIAKNSWQLPLMTLLLMVFLTPVIKDPKVSILMGIIYLLLFLGGLICGILACFGTKTHGKKRILTPGIVGVTLNLSILSLLIAIAIPSFKKARSSEINDPLKMVEAQFESKTPVMIDELTRLDSVKVSDEKSMTYTFTLVSSLESEIDKDLFKESMTGKLYNEYMSSSGAKLYRMLDVPVDYVYLDKNGALITSIRITKEPPTSASTLSPATQSSK